MLTWIAVHAAVAFGCVLAPWFAASLGRVPATGFTWMGALWIVTLVSILNQFILWSICDSKRTLVPAALAVVAFSYSTLALIVLPRPVDVIETRWVVTFILLLVWQGVWSSHVKCSSRTLTARFGVIPVGRTVHLKGVPGIQLVHLETPKFDPTKIDALVLDETAKLPPDWAELVSEAVRSGKPVYDAAALYESVSERVPIWGTVTNIARPKTAYKIVKRALDVILVLLSLPITVPICALTAVAVKLDSPGPVLFIQERIGENGRTFRLVKFRSMRHDAASSPKFASQEDDRITRVGRVIRRFRIDELPQLWNVLRGDMSLIGPRPEQVPFVREFERTIPYYGLRHLVKPGITGLAQVEQGYAAGVDETREKLEYDLYYVKHMSFLLDLSILVRTIKVVLGGFGAR